MGVLQTEGLRPQVLPDRLPCPSPPCPDTTSSLVLNRNPPNPAKAWFKTLHTGCARKVLFLVWAGLWAQVVSQERLATPRQNCLCFPSAVHATLDSPVGQGVHGHVLPASLRSAHARVVGTVSASVRAQLCPRRLHVCTGTHTCRSTIHRNLRPPAPTTCRQENAGGRSHDQHHTEMRMSAPRYTDDQEHSRVVLKEEVDTTGHTLCNSFTHNSRNK